jgi:hypothetical protein
MQISTKIDLRTDRVSYPPVGYLGEKNQRKLQIIPPRDLSAAAYFMLAFELPEGVFRPDLHLVPPIHVMLAPPVTVFPEVQMTLEGYSIDGTVLGKSQTVILHFEEAVTGQVWDLTGPRGNDGATFFPEIASGGVLSWTNNGGYENPETVNLTGPPGQDADAESITNMELDEMLNLALSVIQPI